MTGARASRSGAVETVLAQVSDAVTDLGIAGQGVLVAVSGGVDSTVLAHALHSRADALGLAVSLGHINHTLRGDDSEADEAGAAALAARLGVPFACERVDPRAARDGRSSRARPTLQEAARHLRYQALNELRSKTGASVIATAHNADDQAETVLLRLMRGCGPDGLGGIPEVAHGGAVVRPLLCVTRREIVAYAKARKLSWREDTSNLDTRYTRNRLRRWLPTLASDFNPQLLRTIGNLAEAHRRDAEWITSLVETEAARTLHWQQDALWIDPKEWKSLPEALARRLVRAALCEFGAARDVTRVHVERVLAFLDTERGTNAASGGRILELPGGVRIVREAGEAGMLRFYRVDA